MQPFTAASSDAPRCSAKGCVAAATSALDWRNPTLHAQARVKTWLACDVHVHTLGQFLSARGFLLSSGPYVGHPTPPV